ncbi:hypothetical protein Dtox_2576 [Desulfofarcimen acetoxidans DSM 771]|uniref:Uncharacterized protein n=1 Tax=Desulfofarcimen acetoxidans (strain ATCC 49208 / DSM 771 / KCTC 5769 / VKM B-1644 / 5575) TaxID=485916 RepID=C8W0X3_DESAS|nr:hypothetical protein Dtox_2576 [Desulfofarcimen acetoxidans DSM 771]
MSVIGELSNFQKKYLIYMSAAIVAEQWKHERKEIIKEKHN